MRSVADGTSGPRIPPRRPLGEEVHTALKTAILEGELRPGERLIEARLAERLGASRTPVRQAMHILEREGLALRQERGGFVVRPLYRADVEEILDLRVLLEPYAARKATGKITDEELYKLRRLNKAFGRALETGDPHRLAALNTEFHEILYTSARSPRLLGFIHDLRDHFHRYRLTLLRMPDMARRSFEDHREMIAAMSAGDSERVEAVVRRHILTGRRAILAEIEAGRLGG